MLQANLPLALRVINTLTELKEFMTQINEGLATEVEPDNAEALLKAMTCIRDVRLRADIVTGLWEPLKDKVGLLKKHGVIISEDYIEMLDNAPYDWADTTKTTLTAREQLLPLQSLQAEKIKEQAEEFGYKVADLREAFLVFDEDRNGLELPEFKVMLTDLCKREDRGQAGEKDGRGRMRAVKSSWVRAHNTIQIFLGHLDRTQEIQLQVI